MNIITTQQQTEVVGGFANIYMVAPPQPRSIPLPDTKPRPEYDCIMEVLTKEEIEAASGKRPPVSPLAA